MADDSRSDGVEDEGHDTFDDQRDDVATDDAYGDGYEDAYGDGYDDEYEDGYGDEYDDEYDDLDDDDDGSEPIALIARVALVALLLTGIGAAAFVLLSDDDDGGDRTEFASSPIDDTDETSAETDVSGAASDDGEATDDAETGADTGADSGTDAGADTGADDGSTDEASSTESGDAGGEETDAGSAAGDADGDADGDDTASAGDNTERESGDGEATETDADSDDDAANADDADDDPANADADADDAAGDAAGSGGAGSADLPAAVDTDSPRPTSADVSYATQPDGRPVPILAMFDDDRIVLEGSVPSEEAAAFLRDLALINSQFPDIPIEDRLVVNPDVPATVGVRVLELNSPRFPTSSSDVSPQHAEQLDRLVPVLQALPNVQTVVVGHADQRGDPAANYVLSTDRAQSVVDYLVFKGVEPERLSARAVGANDLLSMAEDLDSLALNRRTEFILTGLLLGV